MKYILSILVLVTAINCDAQNYIVTPKDIFDFSGFANPDPNKPQNFHDGYPHIDPKNAPTTYTSYPKWDTTKGTPDKLYAQYFQTGDVNGVFYPGRRGANICEDLTGLLDLRDTTKKFVFTDIYALNGNFDAGDTMFFYNGDKILRRTTDRWAYMARPDSLLTPMGFIVSTGTPGQWLHVSFSDSCRYLWIRWTIGPNGKNADFAELVYYGHRNYDSTLVTTRAKMYTGPLPSYKTQARTFEKVIGTNQSQGYDTNQLFRMGSVRTYWDKNYYDTAAGPTYSTFRFFNPPDMGVAQLGYFNRRHNSLGWFTMQGGSQYAYNSGHGNFNIDISGTEPCNPASFTRNEDLFFNVAAKYGSVAVSSGLTKWTNDGGFPNGLNVLPYMEIGNETEGHGVNYLADFMQCMAAYRGVKRADPSMKVVMPGMVDIDSNKVKTWALCAAWLAHDSFPCDVINFHRYWSNRDRLPIGITFNFDIQVGMHAVGPEFENTVPQYDSFARRIYKYIDTSYQIWNTEHGLGNWGTPAASEFEASLTWDVYCSPGVGIWDSMQYKGIRLARAYLLMPFTPVCRYNTYLVNNLFGDTANNHFNLFVDYGLWSGYTGGGDPGGPFMATNFYPPYFYIAAFQDRLKGYYPDSIVVRGDTSGLWHVRYRKWGQTDSVCHAVWKGSESGSQLTSQTITTGYMLGNSMQKTLASFTTVAPTLSTVSTVANTLAVGTVNESPQMFFGVEVADPHLWTPVPWRAIKKAN